MLEAEVILRLAMYYIDNNLTKENVTVSIDGAHVKTGNTIHFDIFKFLTDNNFLKLDNESDRWQGVYSYNGNKSRIIIISKPGIGDVNVRLENGKLIYVECKKGKKDKRGQEYPLMREAIGQVMTSCDITEDIIPMVAVPYSEKSKELAKRWSKLTQIKNLGIKFALVCEDGKVSFID